MDYFDLHCDSAFELYRKKADLYSNSLGVSLEKYQKYNRKAQIFAVWCDSASTDDEAYLEFRRISAEFASQIEKYSENAVLCTNRQTLEGDSDTRLRAILAVEDARLLGNDISRLERLYDSGVRLLTLGWQGSTGICGAYDTDTGLTPFGFEVLKECESLGITIDVSHLSEKAFWDVAGKATKPFCATHSNSAMLCPHTRNLTDTQFRTVAASGGVVGVSFVGKHLSARLEEQRADADAVYETICTHIEHFLEMAPEAVCIGSDFDGTQRLPGLSDVSEVESLADALQRRICSEQTVSQVFYTNAYRFFHDVLEN